MKTETIIRYDSPEAASFKTATGWVDRDGRFFGDDEHMARWSGCTHLICECGKLMAKSWTKCDECRHYADVARWEKMELVEWDGETPFMVHDSDRYFFNVDDFYDYCSDNETLAEDVPLVLCEPNYFRPLDADYFGDHLPEDGDVPDEIAAAIDDFNKILAEYGKPASWSPTKTRIIIRSEKEGTT